MLFLLLESFENSVWQPATFGKFGKNNICRSYIFLWENAKM